MLRKIFVTFWHVDCVDVNKFSIFVKCSTVCLHQINFRSILRRAVKSIESFRLFGNKTDRILINSTVNLLKNSEILKFWQTAYRILRLLFRKAKYHDYMPFNYFEMKCFNVLVPYKICKKVRFCQFNNLKNLLV